MITFKSLVMQKIDRILRGEDYELDEDLRVWVKDLPNGNRFIIPINAIHAIVRGVYE